MWLEMNLLKVLLMILFIKDKIDFNFDVRVLRFTSKSITFEALIGAPPLAMKFGKHICALKLFFFF